MDMGLTDKVVIITGAASGIGLAIARAAQQEGVGAIIATDRDADGLAKAGFTPDQTVIADLTDPHAPAQIVQAALARHGRVDCLVNAAGLTTRASMTNGTADVWDQLFNVNAKAGYFLMQAVIRDLQARNAPGSIVNILSMNAHCGIPDLAIYSATKAAMLTLTKNAARAHMADRIRVNGINLGWVPTESERHMQSVTLGRGAGWEAAESAKLPLGRLIQADEAARLAIFLLGAASNPMSGSVIDFEQKVAGAI